ncbi:GNAT family N-acetyltransferase [Bacillus sp. 2205SS5-2]|uniref:GNAT family N-acetyltransferase n=1 Tax=Bacillus sp. 2205SS5-2 TaxID=3109031 RepID=UPI003004DF61
MKKTLEQVNIVEYQEGLAKGIAKMWNESRENWGGDSSVSTEQSVLDQEANSTNLHLFLALVGEEVVGYCSLSQYREDEGALYIPLLNVHPQYQGLKVGKQLVLKAVEKTIESGWPRLDLYTWAGNTKAVPLYKKCGFFWEDRDDTTHLMNFIPSVLQLSYLKPFFDKHDWYSTSQRVLEVKPDGFKQGEHTLYEYKWEADQEFVSIQFERTGRGIRRIETNELSIEMNLADFKYLEKEEHFVQYKILNKTSSPLHVTLTGQSTAVVCHDVHQEVKINEHWEGAFPVTFQLAKQEPSPWKTHPSVETTVDINGHIFPLKMGVFPIQAGNLSLKSVQKQWKPAQMGTLFLDIESQLSDSSTWTVILPENDVVNWNIPKIEVEIEGKGRLSLPLDCELIKNGFLAQDVEVRVKPESGETFRFFTRLTLAFPGYGAKFAGETKEQWVGYNGPFYVEIEKRNSMMKIGSIHETEDPLKLFTPMFGKPFSEEFAKKEADSFDFVELPEGLVMKTTLQSDAFSPLLLNTYTQLFGDGLIEIKHEVVNNGEGAIPQVALLQPIFTSFKGMAIPQKEGIMIGDEALVPFMEYIRDKDISENWLFATNSNGETTGLAWPEEAVGRKDNWRFAVEYQAPSLSSGENVYFGPISVGINTSTNWSQWRERVVKNPASEMKECSMYALEPVGGDMISSVGEKVEYGFRSLLTPYLHGILTLNSEGNEYSTEADKDDALSNVSLLIEHKTPGVHQISGEFHSLGQKAAVDSLQLVSGEKEIKITETKEWWEVDNGVLSFKASASYYPGIFSLIYNGKETLHHQFPQAGPKSWWNPWGGGIGYLLHKVSPYSMLKETTTINTVKKYDQFGHEWSGLCIETAFTEHEEMKGVVLRQYALTLPEVEVLVVYAEIHQYSGKTWVNEGVDLEAFFKPGENLSSCYASLPTKGDVHTYYAGTEEFVLRDTPSVTIGSDERSEEVHLLHPTKNKTREVYMNQEVLFIGSSVEVSAASGNMYVLKPTVLIYGDMDASIALASLQNLSFK